jgi:hypothetical protein
LTSERRTVEHRPSEVLRAGLADVRSSPADHGRLELIVRRPRLREREVLDEAELDLVVGLVGDSWSTRPNRHMPDRSPHPDMQLTVMNARAAALVAVDPDRRPLAGDQLFIDLDLSGANLPPGARLVVGSAVIEVTAQPHTGCAKFVERFGVDAMRLVNSEEGRQLNLRGINAKVVVPGRVRVGDTVRKVARERP